MSTLTVQSVNIQNVPSSDIDVVSSFDSPEISESSGLTVSRKWENVMWTHNDSGDHPRIFATNLKGEILFPFFSQEERFKGLFIGDAVNIDWEDIATDNQGNLYIAACGNNENMRTDLAIYKIREPHPTYADKTRVEAIYRFDWPDQDGYPPSHKNFDCEAIFWANGNLYLLTKHRSDTRTKLYRLKDPSPIERNTPELIGEFEVNGQVTGADATVDGRRIAILTYSNVWVFELGVEDNDDYFSGTVRYFKTNHSNTKQCEAIAFVDPGNLLITNEQGEIFQLPVEQMKLLRL